MGDQSTRQLEFIHTETTGEDPWLMKENVSVTKKEKKQSNNSMEIMLMNDLYKSGISCFVSHQLSTAKWTTFLFGLITQKVLDQLY